MSRIAMLSIYSENYKTLADITWNQNKALYCAKHGYTGYNVCCGPYHNRMGFDKFKIARPILDHHDWLWITDTDSMITNFQKDVYNSLDLQYDKISFVGAFDVNTMNGGSLLFKNDVWGRTLMDAALASDMSNEQDATLALIEQNPFWRDRAKFPYQWEMNSYDYTLYNGRYADIDSRYQQRGQWQEGDLLIHWPGVSFDDRMRLANEYLNKVTM